MKIMAFMGSARKNGGTAALVNCILGEARKNGHKTEQFWLSDMKLHPCRACYKCRQNKVKVCVHKDEFTALVPKMKEADLFIFATPVYFGHMSGVMKVFIDRMLTFCMEGFKIRGLTGKKYITVVTSGAPEKVYCAPVTKYFKDWLGSFFKLSCAGTLTAGGLAAEGDMAKQLGKIKKAEKLGASL